MKKLLLIIVFLIPALSALQAQEFSYSGQASTWCAIHPFDPFQAQVGVRYLPEISIEKQFKKKFTLDARISANTNLVYNYFNPDTELDFDLKTYRGWVRYSTPQFEIRAGLQKIAFGPATMLRPLMWFDRLDPRDPLQITDGVYGLLTRYYFLNNANLWLWGLYGNDGTKGWEYIPSNKTRPEFGGRFQFPVPAGEMALSYHNRVADYSSDSSGLFPTLGNITEQKLGLDGRWDAFLGIWFEAVASYQDQNILPSWTTQLNIGMDYTFNVGDGLHVTHEALFAGMSESFAGEGTYTVYSALSIAYPISLAYNATAMVYYDYNSQGWYRFINLQRSWDNFSALAMLFWNPEQFNIYSNMAEVGLYAGTGFQIMLIYNH